MPQNQKNYDFGAPLSSVNPAELEPTDIEKFRNITDEGIKALEERYRTPNWFKVAAGFAKPQLGGFTASLGSAMEALGENVEQEREAILPITQLKVQREQQNMLLGQKIKQNDIFQQWKNSGLPMDERTLGRITSLGSETEVAKAAQRYWDDTQKRITATGSAAEIAAKFPEVDASFRGLIDTSADPTADPEVIAKRRADYEAKLAGAKPPQTDAATWNGMSREQKQDEIYKYAEAQQKIGLTKEGEFKLAHDQALPRLATMGTIRDLALGKGLSEVTIKDKDGKPIILNGQQQMERLLGIFGGDNPVEVIAKAISEGRLGAMFQNAEPLVRQLYMNPESRRAFEQLSKLLARQNVEFRNSAVNPTNAFQELQSAGSANVTNSQRALIGIMDMMAHSERNNVGNYLYVLNKGPDARRIGADPEFYERQKKHAEEYTRIATGPQTYNRPWFYSSNEEPRSAERTTPRTEAAPAAPAAPAATEPSAAAPANTARTSSPTVRSPNTQPRRNTIVGTNGNIFKRDANGRWVDTGEKP
jgi:hypothetical protein